MDDHRSENNAAWRSGPLCRRYALVRFELLPVRSEKVDVAPFGVVLWALGVLSDGQYEVLGAWPVPALSTTEWARVFEELRSRGVERIGAVVGGELGMDTVALRTAYPSATSLGAPPAALPLSRTNTALSRRMVAAGPRARPPGSVSRHQRVAQASDDTVRRLLGSSLRAIARHGPFGELEAAQSFAIDSLRVAERKFARFALGSSAQVRFRSLRWIPEMDS